MAFLQVFGPFELPDWLTLDLILRILDSKAFSAVYWGGAAIVAVIGFIARMKYRDRNLKRLLDAYVAKAEKAEGRERASVKEVIGHALRKARGLAPRGKGPFTFDSSDVFQEAARLCAQRQPKDAIELLRTEAANCEAAITYSKHRVRLAQERAATAYLEIGVILRAQNKGVEAVDAFLAMLKVNPEDLDALRMLGIQYRDLKRYRESEQYLTALLHYMATDQAAVAEIKRELAAALLGDRDYTRAEQALEEALKIEVDGANQSGAAITLESIGTLRTAQRMWRKARRAYQDSKGIFESLGDREGVARAELLTQQMEAAREDELRRRRARMLLNSARQPSKTLETSLH